MFVFAEYKTHLLHELNICRDRFIKFFVVFSTFIEHQVTLMILDIDQVKQALVNLIGEKGESLYTHKDTHTHTHFKEQYQ